MSSHVTYTVRQRSGPGGRARSGSAGIYRDNGELRDGLIHDMLNNVDYNKIIFEAPNPKSQMIFINKFGSNVNLGNIIPNQVLELETQRLGLRSETFNIS